MREHTQLGAGTPHRQAHTAFPQALAQAKSLFELLFGDSDVSNNLRKVGSSGQGAKASFSATLHRGVPVVDGRPSEADRPIHQRIAAPSAWVAIQAGVRGRLADENL